MLNHWRFRLCLTIVTSVILATEWTMAADTPIGPAWWPSRWGAADEAGASNWMTPEKVRTAVTLVKTGKTYGLGRDYEAGMPLFGTRVFALRIPGAPQAECSATTRSSGRRVSGDGDRAGRHPIRWSRPHRCGDRRAWRQGRDEFLQRHHRSGDGDRHGSPETRRGESEAAGHARHRPRHHRPQGAHAARGRGNHRRRSASRPGAPKSRRDGYRPCDAVLIHTGWGSLWMKDNARYGAGQPGIGVEAAKWLAAKQVALVGADNWGVEVGPNPDAAWPFPHTRSCSPGMAFSSPRSGRARRRSRLGGPLHLCAGADQRRHGLAGKSDRHPIIPVSPARRRASRALRARRRVKDMGADAAGVRQWV